MSEEELRDQINKIAVEIEKIEVSAKKKEAYVRNRLSEEFDPKIREVELDLHKQQGILNEIIKSIEELEENKKQMISVVKDLNQKYNNLKKKKEKYISEQCKAISKEKKTKTKVIDRNIKTLEKELKASDKK
ncbi:MAG: hypothetical protein JSV62_01265 [Promethearchaeota archaeon]|nr:MAG: hypothetical protein JSV62_01265 [Candidatus Lokiarchaeota archaeon]